MLDGQTPIAEELLGEIASYLDAVDAFRALGCEPSWGAERFSVPRSARRVVQAIDAYTARERRIPPPRFTV